MFKSTHTISYQNAVEGTWGEFCTPFGRVAFILTKARLGSSGTDNERRLTTQLRPVREVLSVEKLDFNQLLQRDLDDHRVAEGLIPYLLKPKVTGPAFFPPVMAVLLPFHSNSPADGFPDENFNQQVEDGSIPFEERRFGQAYRVQRHFDKDAGTYHAIKLGRLGWNDEYAKLVVLDGQHRAMALLAIDRTVNSLWGTAGTANRYRHFYEHRVRELLQAAGPGFNLDKVEIPVIVCWFPDLNGPGKDPHKAARKLFVDVNKEARAPSEARLTLLSDTELLNIFTRSLLNRLRQDNPPLPLFAIEYDNPEKEAARPVKWSVLTNLNLLKFAITRCVFGPKKYLTDMSLAFGGRQPLAEMDAFMRAQLDVSTLYTDSIEDGDRVLARDALGNENFPVQQVEPLVDRFMASWGTAILTILGKLKPYADHCTALQHTREHWIADDAFSSLAQDALFGGVGSFWTLRSTHNHWLETKARFKEEKRPEPLQPEIVKAWDVIGQKYVDFNRQRTQVYLGKKGEKDVEKAKSFFDIANTHACQLGVTLAFASLAYATSKTHSEVPAFAEKLVTAWNAALESKRGSNENRLLVLGRDDVISNPINRINKLDTPLAVHFRYFWLELLRLNAAREVLDGVVDAGVVDALARKARTIYVGYLIDEQKKAVRIAEPSMRDERLANKARENALKELAKALVFWFEMSKPEAEAAANEASPKEAAAGAAEKTKGAAPAIGVEEEGGAEPEAEGNGGKAPEGQSVQDLLSDAPED
jgi:DNA-sulfur modification-associated